ncbi:DnaB-like helicase N-terminal domain-containing protein [Pseudomonas sp. SCB32]|uniref:DnaB-like helicase N-terminal domain-containing protein n=1 Tax=Pseudomonas sp. SCB32 TaxID=2653853 RepID=UPI0015B732B6
MGYVNCRLYLAMEELMSTGSPIDVVSLAEYLAGNERYQDIGGLRLAAEMAASTPACRVQVPVLACLLRGYGLPRSLSCSP